MAVSPSEVAVARADLDARAASWKHDASVPPDLTPTAVVTLASRALADARLAITYVAAAFPGTAPPPPWPASPEMQAAAARVAAHRDGAEVFVKRKVAAFKSPDKVRAAIVRDGLDLYEQASSLLTKLSEAPRMPDVLALIPRPGDLLAGVPVWLALGALWFLFGDRPRRTRLA